MSFVGFDQTGSGSSGYTPPDYSNDLNDFTQPADNQDQGNGGYDPTIEAAHDYRPPDDIADHQYGSDFQTPEQRKPSYDPTLEVADDYHPNAGYQDYVSPIDYNSYEGEPPTFNIKDMQDQADQRNAGNVQTQRGTGGAQGYGSTYVSPTDYNANERGGIYVPDPTKPNEWRFTPQPYDISGMETMADLRAANALPGLGMGQGGMFDPNVQLDASQVIDKRGQPYTPPSEFGIPDMRKPFADVGGDTGQTSPIDWQQSAGTGAPTDDPTIAAASDYQPPDTAAPNELRTARNPNSNQGFTVDESQRISDATLPIFQADDQQKQLSGQWDDLTQRWQDYQHGLAQGNDPDPQFEASIQGEAQDLKARTQAAGTPDYAGMQQNLANVYQGVGQAVNDRNQQGAIGQYSRFGPGSDYALTGESQANADYMQRAIADYTMNQDATATPSLDQIAQQSGTFTTPSGQTITRTPDGAGYSSWTIPGADDRTNVLYNDNGNWRAVSRDQAAQLQQQGATPDQFTSTANAQSIAGQAMQSTGTQPDWNRTLQAAGMIAAAPVVASVGSTLAGGLADVGAVKPVALGSAYLLKGTGENLGTTGIVGQGLNLASNLPGIGQWAEKAKSIPIPEFAQNPLAQMEQIAQATAKNPLSAVALPLGVATAVFNNALANAPNKDPMGVAKGFFTEDPVRYAEQSGLQQAGAEMLLTNTIGLHDPRNGLGNAISFTDPVGKFHTIFDQTPGTPQEKAAAAFDRTNNAVAEFLHTYDLLNPLWFALETPGLERLVGDFFGNAGGAISRIPVVGRAGDAVADFFTHLSSKSGADIATDNLTRQLAAMTGRPENVPDAIAELYDIGKVFREQGIDAARTLARDYAGRYSGTGTENAALSMGNRLYAGAEQRYLAGQSTQPLTQYVDNIIADLQARRFTQDALTQSRDAYRLFRPTDIRNIPMQAALDSAKTDIRNALYKQSGVDLGAINDPAKWQQAIQFGADTLRTLFLLPGAPALALKKIVDEALRSSTQGVFGVRPADLQLVRTGARFLEGRGGALGRLGTNIENASTVRNYLARGIPLGPEMARTPASTRAAISPFRVTDKVLDSLVSSPTQHVRLNAAYQELRGWDRQLPDMARNFADNTAQAFSGLYNDDALRNVWNEAYTTGIQAKSAQDFADLANHYQAQGAQYKTTVGMGPNVPSFAGQSRMTPARGQNLTPPVLQAIQESGGQPGLLREVAKPPEYTPAQMARSTNANEKRAVDWAQSLDRNSPVANVPALDQSRPVPSDVLQTADRMGIDATGTTGQLADEIAARRPVGRDLGTSAGAGTSQPLPQASPVGSLLVGLTPEERTAVQPRVQQMVARYGDQPMTRQEFDTKFGTVYRGTGNVTNHPGQAAGFPNTNRSGVVYTAVNRDTAAKELYSVRPNDVLTMHYDKSAPLADLRDPDLLRDVVTEALQSGYPNAGAGKVDLYNNIFASLSGEARIPGTAEFDSVLRELHGNIVRDDLNVVDDNAVRAVLQRRGYAGATNGDTIAFFGTDSLLPSWSRGFYTEPRALPTSGARVTPIPQAGALDQAAGGGELRSLTRTQQDTMRRFGLEEPGNLTALEAGMGGQFDRTRFYGESKRAPRTDNQAQLDLAAGTMRGRITDMLERTGSLDRYLAMIDPNDLNAIKLNQVAANTEIKYAQAELAQGKHVGNEANVYRDLAEMDRFANTLADMRAKIDPTYTSERLGRDMFGPEQSTYPNAAGQREAPFYRNGPPALYDPTLAAADDYTPLLGTGAMQNPLALPQGAPPRPAPETFAATAQPRFTGDLRQLPGGGTMRPPVTGFSNAPETRLLGAGTIPQGPNPLMLNEGARFPNFSQGPMGTVPGQFFGSPVDANALRLANNRASLVARAQAGQFSASQAAQSLAGTERGNRIIGNFMERTPFGELLSQGSINGKQVFAPVLPFAAFHVHTTQFWANYFLEHPAVPFAIANVLNGINFDEYGGKQVDNKYVSGLLELSTAAKLMHWAETMYQYAQDVRANPNGNNPLQQAAKIAGMGLFGNNAFVRPFDYLATPAQAALQSATNPLPGKPDFLGNPTIDKREQIAEQGAMSPFTGAANRALNAVGLNVPRNIVSGVTNPAQPITNVIRSGAVNAVNALGGNADIKGYSTDTAKAYFLGNWAKDNGIDPRQVQYALYGNGPKTNEQRALAAQLNAAFNQQQDTQALGKFLPVRVNEQGNAKGIFPPTPAGTFNDNPAPFFYNRNAGEGGTAAGARHPVLDDQGNIVTKDGIPQYYAPEGGDMAGYQTARAQISAQTPVTAEGAPFAAYNRDFLSRPEVAALGSAKQQGSLQTSIDANAKRYGVGLSPADQQQQIAKESLLTADMAPGFRMQDLFAQPGNLYDVEKQYADAKKAGASAADLRAIGAKIDYVKGEDQKQWPQTKAYFDLTDTGKSTVTYGYPAGGSSTSTATSGTSNPSKNTSFAPPGSGSSARGTGAPGTGASSRNAPRSQTPRSSSGASGTSGAAGQQAGNDFYDYYRTITDKGEKAALLDALDKAGVNPLGQKGVSAADYRKALAIAKDAVDTARARAAIDRSPSAFPGGAAGKGMTAAQAIAAIDRAAGLPGGGGSARTPQPTASVIPGGGGVPAGYFRGKDGKLHKSQYAA